MYVPGQWPSSSTTTYTAAAHVLNGLRISSTIVSRSQCSPVLATEPDFSPDYSQGDVEIASDAARSDAPTKLARDEVNSIFCRHRSSVFRAEAYLILHSLAAERELRRPVLEAAEAELWVSVWVILIREPVDLQEVVSTLYSTSPIDDFW